MLLQFSLMFAFQEQGVRPPPHPRHPTPHRSPQGILKTSTQSLSLLIPPVHKSREVTSGDILTSRLLIPHLKSSGGPPQDTTHPTCSDLGNWKLGTFGDFWSEEEKNPAELTCPIRWSSVHRVPAAETPGESAGRSGRGEGRGVTGGCQSGRVPAGGRTSLTRQNKLIP